MITEVIIGLFATLGTLLVGLLPTMDKPLWMTGLETDVARYVDAAALMGHWFPLDAIGDCAALLLLAMGVAFAIRVARIALSFLSAGGGSAG